MNVNTGELALMEDLSKEDLESGFWKRLYGDNNKEAGERIEKAKPKKAIVDLKEHTPLSNYARNQRKKKKKMSQKSKVKNRNK